MEELGKCRIWFGNDDGNLQFHDQDAGLEKGKPMNLRDLLKEFNFYGSTCLGGERLVFKRDHSGVTASIESICGDADYFAMFLDEKIKNKKEMDKYGIDILQCGNGENLKCEKDAVVALIGHPGCKTWDTYPLRLSYGKEIGENSNYLKLDYDSLPGNSGSPVFGKGYKIKGIHQGGNSAWNRAHKITEIKNWIKLGQE